MKYKRYPVRDKYYKDPAASRAPEKLLFRSDNIICKHLNVEKNSKPCLLCGTTRSETSFPKNYSKGLYYEWVQPNELLPPNATSRICIHCIEKLTEEYTKIYGGDELESFYHVCAMADIYYDYKLAEAIYNDKDRRYSDDNLPLDPNIPWVDLYCRYIAEHEEYEGKSFWNSGNGLYKKLVKEQIENPETEDVIHEMSDEEKENYNAIWALYHYDPFEDDPPADRPRLRADLVTMIDDAMNGDLVRMRAALEIVRAFYRIDKISAALMDLQATPEMQKQNANQIKQLVETKTKETTMVTAFSKDHGFAEKYATSKSKGSGTLSAVVRDMRDAHYDQGAVNKYDIETSAAIKQVSDISAESIFKQIAFSDSEYAEMVKQQAEHIRNLQAELNATNEELRLFKEKELKQELLEELRGELELKGIPTTNVDEMLAKEIHIKGEKHD